MTLIYTTHAEQQLAARGIHEADCAAAVEHDKNPWQTKLKAGDHFRFHYNDVTVITDKSKTVVVTAFKGAAGGWKPEDEGL
jgi:hypothetical protein